MKIIKIRNNKEFEAKVKELRNEGYMIIAFCKCFAELEKGDEIIRIEK